ncbi:MAG: glycoside hydrolase family 3 C-terminal domain-containing protein [Bacteroides sp.]|uniref:beta-glucosidase n=1 Tax=Bacteroides sp. TaxID=29523 RepID=UPI002FCA5CA3
MKSTFLLSLLFIFHISVQLQAQNIYPFQDKTLSAEERTNDLVQRMTLGEKIDLLAGYNDFYLHPCERLGIPAFKLADGPLGLSSWGLFGRATAFPSALSLAASWNKELARAVGSMYAQEWRARGIHFLLAPGVNIYRASKGARNFEYFGEDPYLTSAMVVPFIQAVQDGGVIATVKHFAANDQEFDRYTVSTEVSKRALHEIYLPPFKAAVQKGGVKAVMTGYNLVNGVYCTENKYLIDILKKEWEFRGMLMSDWACTYSAEGAANNGLDLEMGSKEWFTREKLLPLVKTGKIDEEVINDKVRRVYGACIAMGFLDRSQQDLQIPTFNPKANKMALDGACEGIVLLKNRAETLPLRQPKVIAVIGPTANPPIVNDRAYNVNSTVYGGGGSSKVHPWYVINALEGIRQEFPEATILYTEGISNQFKSRLFRTSKFRSEKGEQGLEARYYALEADSIPSLSDQMIRQQALAAGRVVGGNQANDKEVQTEYEEKDLILQRLDRTVNYEWWGHPFNESKLGSDYRVCWEGYIDVEKTDSLLFFVDAQGAYRLWIEEQLVLDASRSQSFDVRHITVAAEKGSTKRIRLEYWNQRSTPAEIRMGYTYQRDIDFSEAKQLAAQADAVVFCAGLDGSIELEGRDRPFQLPYGQDRLINELVKINPQIIVAIHAGGGVDMGSWIDKIPAVVHAFYPGQEGGRALAQILSGKVNPSAKLPFTIEKRWEDSPACGYYDETRKEKKVYYNEGIFVGYRGYDRKQVTPLFPFGFGLSYTTFRYSDLLVEVTDKRAVEVKVSFTVTNTGQRQGGEVVQLYVSDLKSKEERPLQELKAFDKVWLNPGESKRVSLFLSKDDFSYFSEKSDQWVFESGDFNLRIGASSKEILLEKKIKL